MRAAFAFFLCALSLGCSGTQNRGAERDALVAWLQAGQRAAYERHDVKSYLSQWSKDAEIIAARGAGSGPFDRRLSRDQIEQTRRERYHRPPEGPKSLSFQDVRVTVSGEVATVRWRALSRHPDGAEMVAEKYDLIRDETGYWLIKTNRFWPLWVQEGKRPKRVFSPAEWTKLDQWAERKACFGGRCPSRLLTAWRFYDAWREAVRMSERPGAAHAWLLRGICAVLSGQVADAEPSFVRALQLDAKIQLPPWRSSEAARRKVGASHVRKPIQERP